SPALAKLPGDEEEVLAGLRVDIAQQKAEVGVLLPLAPGHFAEQRSLAIDDLIMRERQDKIFVEGVEEAKRERIMVELPIKGIAAPVSPHIVHPAHMPFQSEYEARDRSRTRHHRPGGRFLGDGVYVWVPLVDCLIEAAQKGNRFEVLPPTLGIGNPGAWLPGVIMIKHGGHRIDAQAIGMIDVQPKQRTAEQEALHLIASIVKHLGMPIRMNALARIRVLIEVRAVEEAQSMRVIGKVRRHPVEDHANTVLM